MARPSETPLRQKNPNVAEFAKRSENDRSVRFSMRLRHRSQCRAGSFRRAVGRAAAPRQGAGGAGEIAWASVAGLPVTVVPTARSREATICSRNASRLWKSIR